MKWLAMLVLFYAAVLGVVLYSVPVGAQGYIPLPCVGNHGTPAGTMVFRGTGGIINTTPGNVSMVGLNLTWGTSSIRSLMLFDATTIPPNGKVTPDYCYVVTAVAGAAIGTITLDWTTHPLKFNNGLVAAISTDPAGCNTLTADGPNDIVCIQAVAP
jgi:hypothetical protein